MMAPPENESYRLNSDGKKWGRGRLISLSGVDGSGKSTQIKLLQARLAENGASSQRVWCRWRPMTSLPLLFILRRLGHAKIHRTSSIGFVEANISQNSGLALLWGLLTQLDNFLKTGLMVMIPLTLGKTVICDRYVLDLIVESRADLNSPARTMRNGLGLLRFLPRPRHAFLVMVDPKIAFGRKPDMPTLAHFKARTDLYRKLAEGLGVIVLDGSQPATTIHEQIWARISEDRMD